jgi:hypothetical protein
LVFEEAVMSFRRVSKGLALLILLGIPVHQAQAQPLPPPPPPPPPPPTFVEPTITPAALDFGTVLVGEWSTLSFSVTGQNITPTTITGVVLTGDLTGAFSVNGPVLPIALGMGQTATFDVRFEPVEEGSVTAAVGISVFGPPEFYYTVNLSGIGEAPVVEDPAVMIDDLIAFFEAAVASGDLEGVSWGRGRGRGRMAWFKVWIVWKMLHSTERLIDRGYYGWAYWQLNSILKHADGAPRPHDFVKGDAQPEFAAKILDLMLVLENY